MEKCQFRVLSPRNARGTLPGTWHVHENLVLPWESKRKQAEQCKPRHGSGKKGVPREMSHKHRRHRVTRQRNVGCFSKLREIRRGEIFPQLQPFGINIFSVSTQARLGLGEEPGAQAPLFPIWELLCLRPAWRHQVETGTPEAPEAPPGRRLP